MNRKESITPRVRAWFRPLGIGALNLVGVTLLACAAIVHQTNLDHAGTLKRELNLWHVTPACEVRA